MYTMIHNLLADHSGDVLFTCFGVWHIGYLLLIFSLIGICCVYVSSLAPHRQRKFLDISSAAAFGVYILDFFLMPLAYGYLDVEKLPFHVCTAMCVAGFLSCRIAPLKKYARPIALLGFVSNFVYLIYPAGVMWHSVHPLCYRVVQTLLFHGIMTGSCLLRILFGGGSADGKGIFKVTLGMTLWALTGNILYGGFQPEMNWFFLVHDPFGLLPRSLAPWVMPIINTLLFFFVQRLAA